MYAHIILDAGDATGRSIDVVIQIGDDSTAHY